MVESSTESNNKPIDDSTHSIEEEKAPRQNQSRK